MSRDKELLTAIDAAITAYGCGARKPETDPSYACERHSMTRAIVAFLRAEEAMPTTDVAVTRAYLEHTIKRLDAIAKGS